MQHAAQLGSLLLDKKVLFFWTEQLNLISFSTFWKMQWFSHTHTHTKKRKWKSLWLFNSLNNVIKCVIKVFPLSTSMSLAFRVHVCVHMHSHAQSSSLKLWQTLSSLETSAKLHFHDADHHHHEKHIIVPNLTKWILTLWFIKQVRSSRPLWSGYVRQDPLSTAISLVAFASFPQTSFPTLSLQLTCHLFICK